MKFLASILLIAVLATLVEAQTNTDPITFGCAKVSSSKERYGCSECQKQGNYKRENLTNTFYGYCVDSDCVAGCVGCSNSPSTCDVCAVTYFKTGAG